MMTHNSVPKKISDEDLKTLTSQLGRVPEGVCEVSHRDRLGLPVVIRVEPIVRDHPFPSLYWLCHVQLNKLIDHLEAGGLIKKLENEVIPQDPTFQKALTLAHQSYRDERLARLKEMPQYKDIPENFIESLSKNGIGGMADFKRVRCLHMHYAHHLVAPGVNPIGSYLDEHFPYIRESF